MERTKEFFDTWLKSQQCIYENLTEMTMGFQRAVWGLGTNGGGVGGIKNPFDLWTSAVMNSLRGNGTSTNVVQEELAKMLNGGNVYVKLYELWLPFLKAFEEKRMGPEAYKDLMDPAKFKEALDGIFGIDPGALSQISAEATKFLGTMAGSATEFMKPWMEASEQSIKTFPQFVEGQPDSFMKMFHNVFHAFDSSFGRIFHVPALGKDREKIELILKCFDDLSVFLAKNIEYRHMMYATGLAAMERVVETVSEKIKSGEEMTKFDDFFNLWLNVNEKTYQALFQKEEFSKMQGELLEADLNVRKHFFKLMELYLYHFPIALRSEMDDLYKTVYDLKKKVKNLEKQIQVNA
jgi:hypothetical protein